MPATFYSQPIFFYCIILILYLQGVPKKMIPRFLFHSKFIFYPMGEDNLIKLNTYTNLSMLNPNLNSKFTFCVQGVPKLWPILAIMKKQGFLSYCGMFLVCLHEDNLIKLNTYTNLSMLNLYLNSNLTFCVQGVPKFWSILAIMTKQGFYHIVVCFCGVRMKIT